MKFSHQPLQWRLRAPEAKCAFRPWLIDQGSLTKRIQIRCNAFSVQHVRIKRGKPCLDEAALVGLPSRQQAILREVYLYCGDQPVVFAHSVLPHSSLCGPWQALSRLGNKPLGATLFSNPVVKRTPLEYKKLGPRHELYRRACRMLNTTPPFLWARRSVFSLRGYPILVTEVFLPKILELPK